MQMDSTRALLDQLMGKDRNLTAEERPKRRKRWDDEDVCPYYLNGFCPHDLFTNTKSDLGPCPKEHNNNLKQLFSAESYEKRQRCQTKYLRYLKELAGEIDRKIERGQERLNLKVEIDKNDPEIKEREKKVQELNENISTLLAQMEELGDEGKVDESQALLKLVENLRKEKKDLEEKPFVNNPWAGDPTQEKRMQVCPTCAAFLVIGDAEQRVQAHLNGKQHVGYKMIRDKIEEIEKEREEHGEKRETKEVESEKSDGTASDEKPKPKEKEKSKSRDRSRERRRRRSRSRSRSGSRSRSRSPRRSRRRSRSNNRRRSRRSRS